jgi:hypothetical protein
VEPAGVEPAFNPTLTALGFRLTFRNGNRMSSKKEFG